MNKSFPLLLLLLLASFASHAQLGRSLQSCWVHLDKPFYVVGDVVGYQLYLPPEFNGIDINIQAILFDADGQPLWYNYQQTQNASSLEGALLLTNELSTNWHYISFRVWDENRQTERVLLQVPLAVYNGQDAIQPNQVSQQEPTRLKDPVIVDNKNLILTVSISPENPKVGEEVQLTIKATNRRGKPVQADLSLSINDWSQLSTSLAMGMDNLHTGDSLRVVTPDFLTAGFYWQGILLNGENKALPNTQIPAQVADENTMLNTDNKGRFLFQHANKSKDYNLEFLPSDGSIVNVQFMPQRGRLVMGKLFYTPAAFRYLETNRQRLAIYELLQLPITPLKDVQQNYVSIQSSRILLFGDNTKQINAWANSANEEAPIRPSWIWQPGLQTNAQGIVNFTYQQAQEKAAFRIDIVGQSATGQRTRTSTVYRVE